VDLNAYKVDVAVITETHLKKKHADHHFIVDGYALFRRDRVGRRGGGVAMYVNSRLSAEVQATTRGAMLSIVDRPTRGANNLDSVSVNNPCYATVRDRQSR